MGKIYRNMDDSKTRVTENYTPACVSTHENCLFFSAVLNADMTSSISLASGTSQDL